MAQETSRVPHHAQHISLEKNQIMYDIEISRKPPDSLKGLMFSAINQNFATMAVSLILPIYNSSFSVTFLISPTLVSEEFMQA